MSQHRYPTSLNGKPACVLMGWDRPCQGFFLVVEQDCDDDDEDVDGIVYSNLWDPELLKTFGFAHTIDYFIAKLHELGLKVPPNMIDEIKADALANIGNRYVLYNEEGAIA